MEYRVEGRTSPPAHLVRKKETRDFLTSIFFPRDKTSAKTPDAYLLGNSSRLIPQCISDRLSPSGASFCQEHGHSARSTHYHHADTAEYPQIHKRSGKCPLGPFPRLFPFAITRWIQVPLVHDTCALSSAKKLEIKKKKHRDQKTKTKNRVLFQYPRSHFTFPVTFKSLDRGDRGKSYEKY